jgi:large subunit ribosomal protein L31
MKKGIHSEHVEAKVKCGCENYFATCSTLAKINVEICPACHAFCTSKQQYADVGRIEKFQRKYSKDSEIKEKQGKY